MPLKADKSPYRFENSQGDSVTLPKEKSYQQNHSHAESLLLLAFGQVCLFHLDSTFVQLHLITAHVLWASQGLKGAKGVSLWLTNAYDQVLKMRLR